MCISLRDDRVNKLISSTDELFFSKKDLLLFKNTEHGYKDVLDILIEICDYDPIRAEQCAYLTCYKGYCHIKSGIHSEINKLLKEFEKKGLWVQVI